MAIIGESVDPLEYIVGAYLTDKVRAYRVMYILVCSRDASRMSLAEE
jgi:hypothetical protein